MLFNVIAEVLVGLLYHVNVFEVGFDALNEPTNVAVPPTFIDVVIGETEGCKGAAKMLSTTLLFTEKFEQFIEDIVSV